MLHIIVDYQKIVVILFVLIDQSGPIVDESVQSVDSPYLLLE